MINNREKVENLDQKQRHKPYHDILKKYWGYDDFKGKQLEIIESIGQKRDTLGLMPTGGGKSITFQVPALAMEGMCLVITPIVTLIKDQITNLTKKNIKAAAIYSEMKQNKILDILDSCIFGQIKILYVSPERLKSKIFLTKISRTNVSFIAVDEAHCICQWGYDFRPSYLEIAKFRKLISHAPVLALTATATPKVADDIQKQLNFKTKNVIKTSFMRENLSYIVRNTENKQQELEHILHSVEGSAIVYVRTRKHCKEIADILLKHNFSVTYYHAGLESTEKNKRQIDWTKGKIRIIVATVAFGMGIDKPDVRLVVHYDCPECIEMYFQEVGRAGRDGQHAYTVLLWNNSEKAKLERYTNSHFPPKEQIKDIYEHLASFYQISLGAGYGISFEFNKELFCHNFKHHPTQVVTALRILSNAGYIEYNDEQDNKARVKFLIRGVELRLLEFDSDVEKLLITTILRCYEGLFSDFVYIDEAFIARQMNIEGEHQVHLALKSLENKGIILFTPKRRISTIKYLKGREDKENLIIPKNVYEERRDEMEERIAWMKKFVLGDRCRNKILLRYFGEKVNYDCGICDVCRRKKKDSAKRIAMNAILNFLLDRGPCQITEMKSLMLPYEKIDEALRELVEDEVVIQIDGYVKLNGAAGNM